MPPITALLHTENDALRIGRCLETLYPCDHIVVVDHSSSDSTPQLAREFGARVIAALTGADPGHYVQSLAPSWIFCLDPRESMSEALAASLYEWKLRAADASRAPAFSVYLREETAGGWIQLPVAQTRLVPMEWELWDGKFPRLEHSAQLLEGELLRFKFP